MPEIYEHIWKTPAVPKMLLSALPDNVDCLPNIEAVWGRNLWIQAQSAMNVSKFFFVSCWKQAYVMTVRTIRTSKKSTWTAFRGLDMIFLTL